MLRRLISFHYNIHGFFLFTGWVLQASKVCYGAKGNRMGHFTVNQDGFLVGIKLTHISETVSCHNSKYGYWSYWGCSGVSYYNEKNLNTIITDSDDKILYPTLNTHQIFRPSHWYSLPGYHGRSETLVFSDFCTPVYAQKGQTLRIWYGEDLKNYSEGDNGGQHCVDIYAMFHTGLAMAKDPVKAKLS